MPNNPYQLRSPAEGMATAMQAADLPVNRARYVEGFWPARLGKARVVPQFKHFLRVPSITMPADADNIVYGMGVWLSANGSKDCLVVITGTSIKYIPLWFSSGTVPAYQYDYLPTGQRSSLKPGATVDTGIVLATNNPGISTLMFKNELIISLGGPLYRFYRDEVTGTSVLFPVGMSAPNAPTLGAIVAAGVLNGAYQYKTTWTDEKNRESSPSATVTTTALANQKQTININTAPPDAATKWTLYRANPGNGSPVYNFVADINVGTTFYLDNIADAVVNLGQAAPNPGQNDPPGNATIMAAKGDRLLLNSTATPDLLQISNADSPTQFASITDGTQPSDGLQILVGGEGDADITGIAPLGSVAVVFKRDPIHLLYGTDSTNFELRQTASTPGEGCENPRSVITGTHSGLYLSRSGPRQYSYIQGFQTSPIALEIDDLFHGFSEPVRANQTQPFMTGSGGPLAPPYPAQPYATEVAETDLNVVDAFYQDGRYYLCLVDKTLVYDTLAGGWADTGWGLLRAPIAYHSAYQSAFAGGAPATIFATYGSIFEATRDIYYWTTADQWNDPDAFTREPKPYVARTVTGNYDDKGQAEGHRRRGIRLALWGETKQPNGSRIGTLLCWADGKAVECYPIIAGQTFRRPGALFEQEFMGWNGDELWLEFQLTDPSFEMGNQLVEYVMLEA